MATETRNKWPVARQTKQGQFTLQYLLSLGLEKAEDVDSLCHWMFFPKGWTHVSLGPHRKKYKDENGVEWFIHYDDEKGWNRTVHLIPLKIPPTK